eukprot:4020264-Prorocentrum_lima.AAC.1
MPPTYTYTLHGHVARGKKFKSLAQARHRVPALARQELHWNSSSSSFYYQKEVSPHRSSTC